MLEPPGQMAERSGIEAPVHSEMTTRPSFAAASCTSASALGCSAAARMPVRAGGVERKTRRLALARLGSAVLGVAAVGVSSADTLHPHRSRWVWLRRQQTGEEVRVAYAVGAWVIWPGYFRACQVLRDLRSGIAVRMDVRLLDAISDMQSSLRAAGMETPWVATSGYRSALSNAEVEGAARDSAHQWGRATDGYFEGLAMPQQAALAAAHLHGGLGWYPHRGFMHLDTGRLRRWARYDRSPAEPLAR